MSLAVVESALQLHHHHHHHHRPNRLLLLPSSSSSCCCLFPTKFKPSSISIPFRPKSSSSSSSSNISMDESASVSRRRGITMDDAGSGSGSGPSRASWIAETDDDDDEIRVIEGPDQEPVIRRRSAVDRFVSKLFAGGLESSLNRLSKWLISAILGVIILWRHDAEALWAIIGSIANAVLSTALKRVLNQERPVSTLRSNSKSDPGMPSSHAQSIFFAVTFIILSTNEALGMNALSLTLSGLIVVIGSYFAWLRVSQQYHTMSQVVVGSVLGFSFAITWFWSWNVFLLKEFETSLEVQLLLVVGAAIFAIGFLVYVVKTWFTLEE